MNEQNSDCCEDEIGSGEETSCGAPDWREEESLILDAKPEPTIEEVEAALVHMQETPVSQEKDPFWHDQAERFLRGLLERLKNEVPK